MSSDVDNLVFPVTYGQDDSTKYKDEPLSKEEAKTLILDNFMHVSTTSRLPKGTVLKACQLLFGQGSGTSGNGKHRSLPQIKKRATKAQENYNNLTSSDEKTDGNDDGECVVFF